LAGFQSRKVPTDSAEEAYYDLDEALDDAANLLRRREKLIEDVNHGIERISRGETVPFDLREMKAAVRERHDPAGQSPDV
jgi:hypothetical protein